VNAQKIVITRKSASKLLRNMEKVQRLDIVILPDGAEDEISKSAEHILMLTKAQRNVKI
jgi:hypothetical protein